jgi:hypothetical protein
VLPSIELDYELNMFNLRNELPMVQKEVDKFIEFISRCEDQEKIYVKDFHILSTLNQKGKLSAIMSDRITREQKSMMSHNRKLSTVG